MTADADDGAPFGEAASLEWTESARHNAQLMARLAAADAIGPTAWRT